MRILTFILSLFICSQSFSSEQVFELANKQYVNENYSLAISLYDSIITTGLESSELYYNLGNCYYKTNDWANAIWNYEKSLQLKHNEKTVHNLKLANLKIIDRIVPLPQLFYKKWWNNLNQTFNTQFWQILALLSIGFIFIFRIISLFTSLKSKLFTKIFSVTTVILLFLAHGNLKYPESLNPSSYPFHNNFCKKEAIIFSETTTVNSAPTISSTNLFTLHQGSKVEVIDSIGDWINIKIANGNSGWIAQNSTKEL